MMIKATLFLLVLSILLTACSLFDQSDHLYLRSPHAGQLKEGMEISISGIEVGTLKDIQLQKDLSVLSTLLFKEKLSLPVDSKFSVINTSVFGSQALAIRPGVAQELLVIGDTVNFTFHNSISFDSTLTKDIIDLTQRWLGKDAQKDSILLELRKLNRRLEELQAPEEN